MLGTNDASIPCENAQFSKVDGLWFDDGSLVIRAEDKGFRIFRSVLTAKSSVFRDMASMPLPTGPDQEVVDGCPVVYLPDSATELTSFLKAVFEPESFLPPPTKVPLSTVCGILRISHKYDAPHFRQRATEHLSKEIPRGVSKFHSAIVNVSKSKARTLCNSIGIFREVDVPWALPFCYTIAASLYELDIILAKTRPFDCINDSDIRLVLKAREQMSSLVSARAELYVSKKMDDCLKLDCITSRHKHLRLDITESSLIDFLNPEPGNSYMCSRCLPTYRTRLTDFAKKSYMELPSIFGLPDWDTLRKRDDGLSLDIESDLAAHIFPTLRSRLQRS